MDTDSSKHMDSDMEKQGGRKRQHKEGNGSDACYLDVDAEGERCPQKARKELEENISAEHGDVISQVADLVKDRIFSLLGVRDKVQAAQVCSSWRNAVYRPFQWKAVKVRVSLSQLPQEALSSLKERKIRHLKVGFDYCVELNILDMLRDCLISLDLGLIPLSLSRLEGVFCKSFISLKKLCVFVNSKEPLVFQRVQEIFWNLPNLEDLDLLHADKCENYVVEAVGRCLKNLKQFSLRKCWKTPFKLESLGHLSGLQSLILEKMTLQGIDFLKLSSKSLKKVSLKHCHFDSERWPEALCQLSSLEELKLEDCTPAVEGGLRQLAQGQRNLKVLMYDLAFDPPFVLDLWSLAEMPNLETLSLTHCCVPNDEDVRALSCGLKNLKSLSIHDFHNFHNVTMKGIAGLSSLQELSLSGILGVSGTALEILSSSSCQLRKLELMSCLRTRGEDMKHVAGMSSLRDLTLCNMILDSTGINCLRQGTLRLEALRIEACGFSFQGLKPWLEKQQSLRWLKLEASGMTEAEKIEAQNLKKVLPSLKDVVLTPFWI